MYGYDLSSRSRMLKRGRYCLMKFCSASSASASVCDHERLDVVDHRRSASLRELKVRRDPLADRLRLAHVDDAPPRVAEEVDARLVGQRTPLLGQPSFRGVSTATLLLVRIGGACSPRPQPWLLSSVAMTMHRRLAPPRGAPACVVLAAPAQANYRVGMGDQDAACSTTPTSRRSNIKRVRYLVPYDWYKHGGQDAEVDVFMNRARAADAEVLVHFTARRGCYTNGRYSSAKVLPRPERRGRTERLQALPQGRPRMSRRLGVWNEGNHVSQPTAQQAAAGRASTSSPRAARAACTLVAADVLDSSNMDSWLTPSSATPRARRILGLHNYGTSTASARRHRSLLRPCRARCG